MLVSCVKIRRLEQLKETIAQESQIPAPAQSLIFQEVVLDEDGLAQVIREAASGDVRELQLVKVTPSLGGTHLGRCCLCSPAPDEVCWGYNDSVKRTCPQCSHEIKSPSTTTTDGCRHNGDAYGFVYLQCENCGLKQKHGWDDK